MSLNCWLFSQVDLPTILLLMIITSLAYCSYHHTLCKAAFTLGAQVQSPLGTNVNAPFFFSSTPARIRARCRCPRTRSRPCTRAWAPGPCENTIFVPGSPHLVTLGARELVPGFLHKMVLCLHFEYPICDCVHSYSILPHQTPF